MIQNRVIAEYRGELERAKQPGYQSRYDDFDIDDAPPTRPARGHNRSHPTTNYVRPGSERASHVQQAQSAPPAPHKPAPAPVPQAAADGNLPQGKADGGAKAKPDEFPKDSMAILELGKEEIIKKERVKNFKTPAKAFGWVAYQLEKTPERGGANKPQADSLIKVIDSLRQALSELQNGRKNKKRDEQDPDFANDVKPWNSADSLQTIRAQLLAAAGEDVR
jgi:hypothetical protein